MNDNTYRYTVKSTKITVNGELVELYVIVLLDITTQLWVMMTDYADLVIYKNNRDSIRFAVDKSMLHDICKFLNAVMFEQSDKYGISSPLEITKAMAQDYLDDYAHTLNKGKHPQPDTVRHVRNSITVFLDRLAYDRGEKMLHIKPNELYSVHYEIGPDRKKKAVTDYALKIHPMRRTASGYVSLERDMPIGLVDRFIKMARIYDPELEFAIVLMAYAGLRQGEVCNVRRKSSVHGPGYKDTVVTVPTSTGIGRKCEGFELDLTRELVMRSDGKSVGKIKVERKQPVYGPFAQLIYNACERHLRLTCNKRIEEYGPMFVSELKRDGLSLAMTTSGLRERLEKLFCKHVLPSCKDDPEMEMQLFYDRMKGRTWGGHDFRHWFTVTLVLYGCDQATIMSLRGDRSPESSRTYLERKGVFQRMYEKAVDKNVLRLTGGNNGYDNP